MWLMLMSEIVGPCVIHISRVQPARIKHEWIETAWMSISEICKEKIIQIINEKLFITIYLLPNESIK
jgi:hypothetical protein